MHPIDLTQMSPLNSNCPLKASEFGSFEQELFSLLGYALQISLNFLCHRLVSADRLC